jgi:hypothetical protein
MPITTPVIVQSASRSGPGPLSLPNPVTVGNQLVLLVLGSAGFGDYIGFSGGYPSGFAVIGSGPGQDNLVQSVVLQCAAETPVAPTVTLANGFSSGSGIYLEIANSSSIQFFSGNLSGSAEIVTLGQAGSIQTVASLYVALAYTTTAGLEFSAPAPPGVALGAVLNGYSSFEGSPYTGIELIATSDNPVTFQYTQSAPFAGGYAVNSYAGIFVLAGEATAGPVVPNEDLVQPAGTQDVVYAVVERVTVRNGVPYRFYTVEVMASRLLGGNLGQAVPNDIEYSWAVDAGVQVAPSAPEANLWITPGNLGEIGGVEIVVGGDGYPSSVVASIIDLVGNGSGAEITLAVSGGVITGYTLTAAGTGYVQPEIQIQPSTGDGAIFALTVSNTCTISADAAIWNVGKVGDIIRAAGAKLQITSVIDSQHVVCNVLEPFTQYIPNTNQPASCVSGEWTEGPQFSQLPYLDHLEGMQVVGLADGQVIGPLTVTNGAIQLPEPASIVTAGLGYVAQLKTLRLDLGNQGGGTIQSKRKSVSAVTLRVQDTQGVTIGPTWNRMTPIKPPGYGASNAPAQFSQGGGLQEISINGLYGQDPVTYLDQRSITGPNWDTDGQICIQQANPLPMTILAVIPEISIGDS